jgi:capsular polysaccharide biosynthesis protein
MARIMERIKSAKRVTLYSSVILGFILAGMIAGYVFTAATPPVYQATTTLMVGDVTRDPSFSKNDVDASMALAATYAALTRQGPVLGPVVQELGLPITWQELKERVHVDVGMNGSPLVTIGVTDGSVAEAMTIANAIATQVIAISPTNLEGSPSSTSAFVLSRMEALQGSITDAQARLDVAKARLAGADPAGRPSLRARISSTQSLILRLQANYAALASLVRSGGSPNVVQVVQPAVADPTQIRPNGRVDVLLGAVAGLVAGLIVASFLSGRRARPQSQGERDEAIDPDSIRETDYAAAGVSVPVGGPDPWIHEMNGPGERSERV